MMKVLLVNNRFETRGGADIVFIEEGYELNKLGYQTGRVFVSSPETLTCNSKMNFKIHTYFNQNDNFIKRILKLPLFFFNPFAFIKMIRAIKLFKPDIIHYHIYKGELTWSVVFAGKLFGSKLILTSHDYGLVDPHNLLLDGKLKISLSTLKKPFSSVVEKSNRDSIVLSFLSYLEYKIERFFIPPKTLFDKIICVSNFQKAIYQSSWLSLSDNIEIISNYSRLESSKFKISRQEFYLFVGRISSEKGINELQESFKKLSNLKLLIVGGDKPKSFETLSNVSWLGKVQGLKLAELFFKAKFLIVPSVCHENNSLAILESLSLGTPVISSDYGGSPEMVINLETGFLFSYDIKDNILDVIKTSSKINNSHYLKMASNCTNFYKNNYSKQRHFQKLNALYKKINYGT